MNLFISYSMKDDTNATDRGYKFLGAGRDQNGNEVHVFEAMSLEDAKTQNFECDLVSTEAKKSKTLALEASNEKDTQTSVPDMHEYKDADGWKHTPDSELSAMWKFYAGSWYDFAMGLMRDMKKRNHS